MQYLSLFILLLLMSCAVKPAKEHIQAQNPDIVIGQQNYQQLYKLLKDKMIHCYQQQKGNYHIMGEGKPDLKTISLVKPNKKKAVIFYQYKTEFKKEILFYLDIQSRGPASSEIKVYGKGKGIRTRKELVENLNQWLQGKKAYCIGRGKF